MRESLNFKLREDLSINCHTSQSLSIKTSSTKSNNIFLNTTYRPTNGDMKQCETHFGSSVVFLVQGQHIHQSTSLGKMLAKTFFYIFLVH